MTNERTHRYAVRRFNRIMATVERERRLTMTQEERRRFTFWLNIARQTA